MYQCVKCEDCPSLTGFNLNAIFHFGGIIIKLEERKKVMHRQKMYLFTDHSGQQLWMENWDWGCCQRFGYRVTNSIMVHTICSFSHFSLGIKLLFYETHSSQTGGNISAHSRPAASLHRRDCRPDLGGGPGAPSPSWAGRVVGSSSAHTRSFDLAVAACLCDHYKGNTMQQ